MFSVLCAGRITSWCDVPRRSQSKPRRTNWQEVHIRQYDDHRPTGQRLRYLWNLNLPEVLVLIQRQLELKNEMCTQLTKHQNVFLFSQASKSALHRKVISTAQDWVRNDVDAMFNILLSKATTFFVSSITWSEAKMPQRSFPPYPCSIAWCMGFQQR